jgi:hypothetical protein
VEEYVSNLGELVLNIGALIMNIEELVMLMVEQKTNIGVGFVNFWEQVS